MNKIFNYLGEIIITLLLVVMIFLSVSIIKQIKELKIVTSEAMLASKKAATFAEDANIKSGEASASASGCMADVQALKTLLKK